MEAIVSGLICLDIIPHFFGQAVLAPGKVSEIGAAALATGGVVANTGLCLHRLGISTGLMGKIGDDLFGQAILQMVNAIAPALSESLLIAPGETTSYTIVISPPGMDRIFFHCPGANHSFGVEDVRYDLVARARLFHLGYPPYMHRMYMDGGSELIQIYSRVKSLGVTTSLDLALPDPGGASGQVNWPALLANVLPHVDLLLPSIEELCFMLDRKRYDSLPGKEISAEEVCSLATACVDMGARVVVLKCGARGLYIRTAGEDYLRGMGRAAPAEVDHWANRELWSPCFKPHALVGTTGAGDATIAGFLAALLRGCSIEKTATLACAVGACSVEAADALSGVRTWENTERRVQAGWPRLPVELPEEQWRPISGGLYTSALDASSVE